MKRVLITGISGFIGGHLMEHILANTDWEIVGLDSFRHKGLSERITDSAYYQAEPERVTILTHDLSIPFSRLLVEHIGEIDYIINMAAESHVDRSIEHPVWTVQNNVGITLNVLEYARMVKPKVVIQISTDEVYGPALSGTMHEEWSTILPSNPYAASKAAQEAIAIAYWRTYGLPIIITNTMNNFGERQDPEKYLPMIIRSLRNGGRVSVHGKPGAIGSRFWLHARNHADALCWILQRDLSLIPVQTFPVCDRPERYHIVGNLELNNLELAQQVADCMQVPIVYDFVDHHSTRPGHDPRYALDGSLIANLGWKAPLDFGSSLQRTVDWYMEHPAWLSL